MTSSTLNLASLTSTQGFKITGANSGDQAGYSVSTGGDINGDGYDDIAIGAPVVNSNAGITYVIYGKPTGFTNIALASLNSSQGFTITGVGGFSGVSIDIAGDINGDGYSDILISKLTSTTDVIGYVIFGHSGSFSNINLASLTLNQGFSITGINPDPGNPRKLVSWAGDVNKDGYDDIVIGTPGVNSNTGAAYIILGKANGFTNLVLSNLTPSIGIKITGANSGDLAGWAVSAAGDINKDGYDDVIIGAYGVSSTAGATYIIFGGKTLTNINLASIAVGQGFTIAGCNTDKFGSAVAGTDINGDGYADIIIGAPYSYNTGGVISVIDGTIITKNFACSSVYPQGKAAAFLDNSAPGLYFGASISKAGDINGDGLNDYIVGKYGANSNAGATYVMYGTTSALSTTTVSSLASAQAFSITGENANDYSGWSVSGSGDINGDGYSDVVIGANGANSNAGATYVIFGSASGFVTQSPTKMPTQTPTIAPTTTLQSGLVAYYPFNGNANDATGNGNNAITNTATLTTDRFGNSNSAYSFNGATSYIEMPGSQFNFVNNMSVSFWVNPDSTQAVWSTILSKSHFQSTPFAFTGEWYVIQYNNVVNNYFYDYITSSALPALPEASHMQLSSGVWSHVTIVKEDATIKYFVNNILVENQAFPASAISSNANLPLLVGASNSGYTIPASQLINLFKGSIDDIKIYNRALPATEVQQLYMEGTQASIIQNGLVAYYPFSGNANDMSGNGNNGAVHSATLAADRFGNSNSAYSFNGATSYIEIPGTPFNFGSDISVACWIKPSNIQGAWSKIIDKSHIPNTHGWFIEEVGSTINKFYFNYYLSSNNASAFDDTYVINTNNIQIVTNSWNHVVLTKQGTTIKYYLNGVLTNTVSGPSASMTYNGNMPLTIGACNCGGTMPASSIDGHFNGTLDDIFIYNRALTATEIQQLYMQGTQTSTLQNGLVAYYPFNGNANDMSGNGNSNDGTVYPATTLVADRFGNANSAYSFDGINSFIEVNNGTRFDFTNNMSISIWIKPSASQTNTATIIEKSHDHGPSEWSIEQIDNNQNLYRFLYFQSDTNTWSNLASGVNFVANQWSHYVVVKYDTIVQSYLNGNLITTIYASSFTIKTNGNLPLGIGASYTHGKHFNGSIDDIFIYNRALSSAEVAELYTLVPNLFTWTPTIAPTYSLSPSLSPTALPTIKPTKVPTAHPTHSPSKIHLMATNIDLASLSSSQGFVINGASAGDKAGFSVSEAGDVNGDGYDDIIIASVFAWPNSKIDAGRVYVIFGGPNLGSMGLSGFTTTSGIRIDGAAAYDRTGYSVASAGDVNKDGYDDIIIGAPGDTNVNPSNPGLSYIILGKNNSANIDLAALTALQGISIAGQSAGSKSGWSVAGAGDVNGDGYPDIIIGAPFGSIGYCYVIYGNTTLSNKNLANLPQTQGFSISFDSGYNFAYAVGGGDINADGYADVIIGSYLLYNNAGATSIIFGKTNFASVTSMGAIPDPTEMLVFSSGSPGYYSGLSIDKAGDVNGDGFNDFIIGAPGADSDTGIVYVIYGKSSYASSINLGINTLTSLQGFSISGVNLGDKCGWSVKAAGDVNRDGYADIVIGSPYADLFGRTDSGSAYVIFGRANPSNINLANLDLSQGFSIYGASASIYTGVSVSGAGDINQDGYDDVIIGATGASSNAGAAYVIYGNAFSTTLAPTLSPTFTPTLIPTSTPTVLPTTAAPTTSLENGLVAYYSFNGNANDATGNGNDGVVHNAALVVDRFGNPSSAYNFDGISSYIEIVDGSQFDFYNDMSVCIWVKPYNTQAGYESTLFDKSRIYGHEWFIQRSSNIDYSFLYRQATDTWSNGLSIQLLANQWNFLTLTKRDITSKFYLNGNLISTENSSHAIIRQNGNQPLFIGATNYFSSMGWFFNGSLDDIRIYNRALTSNEVQQVYTYGMPTSTPTPSPTHLPTKSASVVMNTDLALLQPYQGFVINGTNAADQLGYSVANAGDFNGDGYDDIVIGAYKASPSGRTNAGISYVIFGNNSIVNNINLLNLSPAYGFAIYGAAAGDWSGRSVSGAGDVNGDGFDDVIIAASTSTRAYIIFGKSTHNNIDLANFTLTQGLLCIGGTNEGISVASAGDINNDGYDDVIIGAPNSYPHGISQAGSVFIVFGNHSYSNNINLYSILPVQGFTITGAIAGALIGIDVSSAGDINKDGYHDIIISSYNSAISYVIFGSNSSTNIDLAHLSLTQGFSVNTGYSVSSAGDFNGDGYDDLVIGAYVGKAYIIWGKATGLTNILIEDLNISQGAAITGIDTPNYYSWSTVSGGNDINGDGYDDIILGALQADAYAGYTYIIFGRATGFTSINVVSLTLTDGFAIKGINKGVNTGDYSGWSVSKVGDFNNDGYADYLIGAPGVNNGAGAVYVLYGNQYQTHSPTQLPTISPTLAPTAVPTQAPTLPILQNINLATLPTSKGITISGANPHDNSGSSVAIVGDVNGDGYADFVTCAQFASPNSRIGAGICNILYGGFSLDNIDLGNLTSTQGISIIGPTAHYKMGIAVSSIGDINKDGYDDVVIGTRDRSESYVIYGGNALVNIDIATFTSSRGFIITNPIDQYFGWSVASAGDVNKDNYTDIIIGAWYGAPFGRTNAGIVYVIFGSASLTDINIANFNSNLGFAIYGANIDDYLGYSVSGAGDVNKDGYADVIVGVGGADPNGRTNAGTAYIIYGGPNLTNVDLASLTQTQGFAIYGENGAAGNAVSKAGDVNKDGYDDIIIGAPGYSSGKGKVYVIYGSSSSSNIDLSNLSLTQGFCLLGAYNGGQLGVAIASAWDVNKDGYADIVIGAPAANAGNNYGGISYVIYGRSSLSNLDLANLAPYQGFSLTGPDYGQSGAYNGISGGGDINKDGYDDIIIGASQANGAAGRTYVVYGGISQTATPTLNPTPLPTLSPTHHPTKPTSVVVNTDLALLEPYQGFVINGENAGDRLGHSVASAGDFNGDGLDDIIIGAPYANPYNIVANGISYIIFGKPENFISINLNNLTTDEGFSIRGGSNDGENQSGWSVGKAGDINGDGFDEIFVTAPYINIFGRGDVGTTYILFGKDSGFNNINLASLTMPEGFYVIGPATNTYSGTSASSIGDVNGDGYDDFIIGAPYADPSSNRGDAGICYVILGKSSGFSNIDLANSLSFEQGFVILGATLNDHTGRSVSGAGDINNDGYGDIIIGAPEANSGDGISYIIFGKSSIMNLDLGNFTISQGFSVIGVDSFYNAASGYSVNSAGDTNHDGYDDIIIGAYGQNGKGASYIIFGKDSNFTNIILSDLTNSQGFTIFGENFIDRSGNSVSKAGDVNGDGYDDVIIGSYTYKADSAIGRIYIIFGNSNSFTNIELSSLINNQGFAITGVNNGDQSGFSVSSAGDFNGDGYSDYIIGAPGVNNNAGAVYVFYGNQYQTRFPTGQPTSDPTINPTSIPSGKPTSAPTDQSSLQCINLSGDRGELSIFKNDDRLNFTCSINANETYQSINVNETIFSSEEVDSLPNGVISKLNTTDTDNFCINPEGLKGNLQVSNFTSAGCNIKCSYSDGSYANVYLNATLLGEDLSTKLCNEANLG